jgi:pentatricopeptide repeat protein
MFFKNAGRYINYCDDKNLYGESKILRSSTFDLPEIGLRTIISSLSKHDNLDDAIDLAEKMLELNSSFRITADDALIHSFFKI